MRALLFRPSRAARLAARSLGAFSARVRWGRPGGLALVEMEEPPLPGPRWVRLQVLKAGIGGDELQALDHRLPPLLEPFTSWPAVPGREMVGRVVETGPGVRRVDRGARVVVDPFLSCAARGFEDEPCSACARGRSAACVRAGEEGALRVGGRPLRRGARLGLHADLPGGWSERVLAHEDQLLEVEASLPDRAALLVEPFAAALHAVRVAGMIPGASPDARSGAGPVLVLGGGARALLTVRALRLLGFGDRVVLHAPGGADHARRLGADEVAENAAALRDLMAGTGAWAYMPRSGEEVWSGGGFARVFDWTPEGAAARALRLVAPEGRLLLPRPAGASLDEGELSLASARSVRVEGAAGYGPRGPGGGPPDAFRAAHDLLLRDRAALESLVTHVYPLEQHVEALRVAVGMGHEAAGKVLFDPSS